MLTEGGNSRICSPELLAQIAEVIDSAVLITRFGNLSQFDHRIIYTNPAFTNLTGYKAKEIVGRSPDVLCDPRTSSESMLEFYSRCHRGARFGFEIDSFQKQGGEIKLHVDVTPVTDESQGIHYFILTMKKREEAKPEAKPHAHAEPAHPKHPIAAAAKPHHNGHGKHQPQTQEPEFNERFWQSPNNDLTPHNDASYVNDLIQSSLYKNYEKKKADEKAASAPVTPAEISTDESIAEYCKTQFLANMSHDLRTPLNAIIGFSEVIKDQLFGPIENPRYVSYANDIFRSGQELFSTISEIMELSEIQPDEELVEEERMNICDVVESVIDVLTPKAFESEIKIIKSLEARELCLLGDRRKMKQAVAGVVGNAIKYSSRGSKIEVSTHLTDKGDLKLVVYARSANILPTKSSLMGTVTKKMENEYPEISLAKKFIEVHEGKFAIFNSAVSGTEISITLPNSRLSLEQEVKTLLKVIS